MSCVHELKKNRRVTILILPKAMLASLFTPCKLLKLCNSFTIFSPVSLSQNKGESKAGILELLFKNTRIQITITALRMT